MGVGKDFYSFEVEGRGDQKGNGAGFLFVYFLNLLEIDARGGKRK